MVLFNMPLFIPKAFQPIVMRRLILLSWSFSNFITCPRCLLTSYGLFPLESWTVCYFFRFLFSNRWNINMKCSLILWNQAIIYCPQTNTTNWQKRGIEKVCTLLLINEKLMPRFSGQLKQQKKVVVIQPASVPIGPDVFNRQCTYYSRGTCVCEIF